MKAKVLEMGYMMDCRGAQVVNSKKIGPVWYWRPYSYEQFINVQLKKFRPVPIMSCKERNRHMSNTWTAQSVQSIQT